MPIEKDTLQALVTEALFTSLEQQKRDELVKKALDHLLTRPQSDNFGRGRKAPLEEAWNDAIYTVARELVTERIKTDPAVRAKIDELVMGAFAKLTIDNEKLVSAISGAIVDAMRQ